LCLCFHLYFIVWDYIHKHLRKSWSVFLFVLFFIYLIVMNILVFRLYFIVKFVFKIRLKTNKIVLIQSILSAFQPMECKLCYAPPYYPNNGSFFSLFVPFYFALFCSVHFEIFKFTLKIIEWLNEFLSSHKYLLTSVKVYLYMLVTKEPEWSFDRSNQYRISKNKRDRKTHRRQLILGIQFTWNMSN
jgi:hypothetical protein